METDHTILIVAGTVSFIGSLFLLAEPKNTGRTKIERIIKCQRWVKMSLELGLILTGSIVVLAGIGMAGFLMLLRIRESKDSPNHDGIKHA